MILFPKELIIYLQFSKWNQYFHWSVPFYKIIFFLFHPPLPIHYPLLAIKALLSFKTQWKFHFFYEVLSDYSSWKSNLLYSHNPITHGFIAFSTIFLLSDLMYLSSLIFAVSAQLVIVKLNSINNLVMHYYYVDNNHFIAVEAKVQKVEFNHLNPTS